ncbi:DUF397 domain-containing protein [Streptomyces sp. MK37H]|uniref:DUF397 domain-containing protein n=1 Tax=Streptomyces sp. MK37H TaxID=2699117 RepID=UPI001B37BEAF|nr:DUF397 domain-containing protein [Streptomyces sp. MK37H]MBP8534627.1 DUF397 domain-containing protein [Streptomyces sp. MK37H]
MSPDVPSARVASHEMRLRVVAIHDSKDPDGRILRCTPAAWADFRVALTQEPRQNTM